MKFRLNKQILADMPEQVRSVVQEWKNRHHKAFINVERSWPTGHLVQEDHHYVAINLLTGDSKEARAGGEWAGMGDFLPGSNVKIPYGCILIEHGFFCGHPHLTIYQAPLEAVKTVVLEFKELVKQINWS